ncbi:DNA methylase [Mycobacterium phage DarthPhader]|uniref:DNA (cytosine-5-)-methyltransferase n=1 Tax=Mycobacterium phage DarthPhader TaxID=1912975 RepID=A0A1I9S426_9CAUD|nr:DNA methyltransferase [Mycobacterium phage DarthPhader]AOZ61320.1 DNA methylase [Mycobacterium phage DarthPhader]
MRIGSLFSGVGGLDLAVEEVFGGETVWQSEVNPHAATVLAKRFGVPNLGDITKVDWRTVRDTMPVDVLCGGFPCQDVSHAGLKRGISADTRSGLWYHFATAIYFLRPEFVVIENVRGLLSAKATGPQGVSTRAMGRVLRDLADIGYDASWKTLPAGSVGAPHRRERVFILAQPSHAVSA